MFFLYFLSTAVNNIHLVLHGDLHVQQALALVSSEEAYTKVLELDFEPRDEGDEQPPVLKLPSQPNLRVCHSEIRGETH